MSVEQWRRVPGYPRIEVSNRRRIKRDGKLTNANEILKQSRFKLYRLAWNVPLDHSLIARKSAKPCRGERHGQHKLTVAAVRQIRKSDESDIALARRWRVARQTIWACRTKRLWRHVG